MSTPIEDAVASRAESFATQLASVAEKATKEETIRIEVEKLLHSIQSDAGIELEAKHEFTLAKGFVDTVYDRVIIEYKNPSSAADRIGPKSSSPGTRKVIDQITKRFKDMEAELGHPLNSLFGVGLDGRRFVFVRYRGGSWDIREPVSVHKYSAQTFLWALFNLGTKGKPFTPDQLAADFGADSSLAQTGVPAFYNAITTTSAPKAEIFFRQWRVLFGEVCGYDINKPTSRLKDLAKAYSVPVKGLQPAALLFAIHSYFAVFMKLLAAEIVAYFHKLPVPLKKLRAASSAKTFLAEIEDLEAGSIFRHFNITNFLEGDLFSWYTTAWTDEVENALRSLVSELDNYAPGTLSEDPAQSRDLLKRLYQALFPRTVRHDLGEYYTPDWLAEHVLLELRHTGHPDKRLLDPACGSGTFLVMAINKIRQWFDNNRERCPYDESGLCSRILNNVVGFDLNPIAVMAARTNYLIAIRDLIGHVDRVELPIYLCDSIRTPTEHGGLLVGTLGTAREVKTAAGTFLIPTEVSSKPQDLARYAEQLEFCIGLNYTPSEFIARCNDEGIATSATQLHEELYGALQKLEQADKNGVWARIIKNAFAPVFTHEVDFIIGNPPWINIESVPSEYRKELDPLWTRYELKHSLPGPQIGSSKRDICALFVFLCSHRYLRKNGKIGFVLTQSLFKSKGGGDGFRRFSYEADKKRVYLHPLRVDDFSDLSIFYDATNRTSVLFAQKRAERFEYPVPYLSWRGLGSATVPEYTTARQALDTLGCEDYRAIPCDPVRDRSPWLTVPENTLDPLAKVRGTNYYRAYTGVYTGGLNGGYWFEVAQKRGKKVVYKNMGNVGKRKVPVVATPLESDLVHPLARGRDLHRWHCDHPGHILIPYDTTTDTWIAESDMRTSYPHAFSYLTKIKTYLEKRKTAIVRQAMKRSAFYAMVAVGHYTYASWKVVYKRLSNKLQAAVIPGDVMPHEKVVLVPTSSQAEAHYLASLLNSAPANLLLRGAAVRVQTIEYAPSDVAQLSITKFVVITKKLPL